MAFGGCSHTSCVTNPLPVHRCVDYYFQCDLRLRPHKALFVTGNLGKDKGKYAIKFDSRIYTKAPDIRAYVRYCSKYYWAPCEVIYLGKRQAEASCSLVSHPGPRDRTEYKRRFCNYFVDIRLARPVFQRLRILVHHIVTGPANST